MQPTYLGWLGWFDLLDSVDHMVLLDSVQLNYRSWQHRNRIRGTDDLTMLSVPVRRSDRRARIADACVGDDGSFPGSHVRALSDAYAGSPGWHTVERAIAVIAATDPGAALIDLAVPLVGVLAEGLGVTTPISRSTDVVTDEHRSALLIRCVQHAGGSEYVSPPGSLSYLLDDRALFDDAGIPVSIQQYEHPAYKQRRDPFIPYASAIDTIACLGSDAGRVMRSGRRPEIPLDNADRLMPDTEARPT